MLDSSVPEVWGQTELFLVFLPGLCILKATVCVPSEKSPIMPSVQCSQGSKFSCYHVYIWALRTRGSVSPVPTGFHIDMVPNDTKPKGPVFPGPRVGVGGWVGGC